MHALVFLSVKGPPVTIIMKIHLQHTTIHQIQLQLQFSIHSRDTYIHERGPCFHRLCVSFCFVLFCFPFFLRVAYFAYSSDCLLFLLLRFQFTFKCVRDAKHALRPRKDRTIKCSQISMEMSVYQRDNTKHNTHSKAEHIPSSVC